ncbi:hypothetical protein DY000_02049446 [Brassica cretica]|uniref:Uncharacterized protein n=1 Tax=Brassica cretica TaxID=69181 RepID=A0ABQ7EUH7_BRACR|nr:hypothetical protein DY000_02049446 [Brassica cretica]
MLDALVTEEDEVAQIWSSDLALNVVSVHWSHLRWLLISDGFAVGVLVRMRCVENPFKVQWRVLVGIEGCLQRRLRILTSLASAGFTDGSALGYYLATQIISRDCATVSSKPRPSFVELHQSPRGRAVSSSPSGLSLTPHREALIYKSSAPRRDRISRPWYPPPSP